MTDRRTINITKQIESAYKAYLDEAIGCDVLGTPIRRRDVYPFRENPHKGIVDFAAGFQYAAEIERSECAKVCEGEKADPLQTGMLYAEGWNDALEDCAAAIRARPLTPT